MAIESKPRTIAGSVLRQGVARSGLWQQSPRRSKVVANNSPHARHVPATEQIHVNEQWVELH